MAFASGCLGDARIAVTGAGAERNGWSAAPQKVYTETQRIVFQEDAVMLHSHGQRQVLGHRSTVSGLNPLPFEIFDLATLDVN